MDTQVWSQFLTENWLVILIAVVLLFAVINLVKTVLKWAIVVLIVVGLFIYSGISLDQIGDTVNRVKDGAVETVRGEAEQVMLKEAKDATYTSHGDGTFTIETPNLEVTGSAGSDKVNVSFRGVPLGEWSVNETVGSFIEEARR